MPSSRVGRGKVYAAEEKIRELKKFLSKIKSLYKRHQKRIRPNKLIKKATSNLNKIRNVKYCFALETIESKSIESDQFTEEYDFYRLQKIKMKQRGDQNTAKKNVRLKRKI